MWLDTDQMQGADRSCPGAAPHVLPVVGLLQGISEEPRPT